MIPSGTDTSPRIPWPARFFLLALRKPKWVVLFTVVAALWAVYLASGLTLRTDFAELLPTSDPAVKALERTRGKVGDMNLLLVGIRSPDRAANLRYAEDLTHYLHGLPKGTVTLATYHVRDILSFFERNRWLYASEADLGAAKDRLAAEILQRKNPLYVSLDSEPLDDGGPMPDGFRDLQTRFPDGYFVRGTYAWVAALPPGGAFGTGARLLGEVERFVQEHPPARYQPTMSVLPAGPVLSAIQNRQAIERDILWVTVLCTVLIATSIFIYFRHPMDVLLVALPAIFGTLGAFALNRLAIGYLNSSTAFLGTIILGNGINHAIVFLGRYRERRGEEHATASDVHACLSACIRELWRPTLGAALAAAGAYASLMLTRFRGFSQFGFMGFSGAFLCWLISFLLLPTLVTWVENRGNRPHRPFRPGRILAWLAAWVLRRPGYWIGASVAFSILCVFGLMRFAHDPFECDFRKLSTQWDHEPTYVEFDRNLDSLFGRWHSPQVLLADRLDDVMPMKAAIRRQDRAEKPFIGQVVTIFDVLPGTPEAQKRKLVLLEEIRTMLNDPSLELLSEPMRKRIQKDRPPEGLRVLLPDDLPPLARRPFTEQDGTVGRIVLAYHSQAVSMWKGQDLLGIAQVLQRLALPDGRVVENSGAPMVFGAMLTAILRDGPKATLLSLLAVLLLVPLLVRPAVLGLRAVAILLVGVLWMVGAAGLWGVKITFLNFVALPITFGIGVEYAVNLVNRIHLTKDLPTALAGTGGAVALCSWTTILGYGSLLAAHSQALRGFGAMAVLGEVSCLLAALLVLPAWMEYRRIRIKPVASKLR